MSRISRLMYLLAGIFAMEEEYLSCNVLEMPPRLLEKIPLPQISMEPSYNPNSIKKSSYKSPSLTRKLYYRRTNSRGHSFRRGAIHRSKMRTGIPRYRSLSKHLGQQNKNKFY